MAPELLGRDETRDRFHYFYRVTLRWNDLDAYRHVNNARYYAFFDTVIMQFLVVEGGFDLVGGPVVPFTVENMCRFHRPLRFPEPVDCGLRTARVGRSSVRYELGLFAAGSEEIAAAGYFVDVFVDAASEKPTALPTPLRRHLEAAATPTSDLPK